MVNALFHQQLHREMVFGEFPWHVLNDRTLSLDSGEYVTASSGTAISTDFATLTCSEILSKILIRCVTWHVIALFAVSTKLADTSTTKSKNEQKYGRAAMTEARDGKNIRI